MTDTFAYTDAPPPPPEGFVRERSLLRESVEEFLYYEADLLDQWRYREWLDLVTDDVRYWMPIRRNVAHDDWAREHTAPLEELAYFDENKTTLEMRVRQLETGKHWREEPRSRISHLVTNVRVCAASPSWEQPDEVTVRSRFLVYRNHLEDEESMFVGKREDVLRRDGEHWRIARRSILLDQSVLLAQSITFLL